MGNCFLYKRGFGGGFGGGGGSTPEVEKTASGKGISILDSLEKPLKGLRLFGNTTQNGTPSPDAPVPLESVGDGGSIIVTIGTSESDANPQTLTVSTPNGLPGIHVSEGGNYTDENGWQWICDEVDFGRGKYIQRVLRIASYNGETIPGAYMSSTGALTTGATVLYALTSPIETDLTPEQLAAYAALHTLSPSTTIYNDADSYMEVKYMAKGG